MPLLWALRDELGMVGTKFGCGAGLCGACTVLIDGEATRSCITPVSAAAGRTILTIEGLGEKELHAVQKAWIEADAPQCTIVGEIAEVAVSDRGEVKVERVVACVDCGHLVNPLTAAMQIESAVLYGLTAALFGEITIKQGRVEQGNFDFYPIAKMADAPVIETHFVLSGGDKWGGLGEPGTPPIAPAVANAIFAVTGKRIRSLPLKNAALGV